MPRSWRQGLITDPKKIAELATATCYAQNPKPSAEPVFEQVFKTVGSSPDPAASDALARASTAIALSASFACSMAHDNQQPALGKCHRQASVPVCGASKLDKLMARSIVPLNMHWALRYRLQKPATTWKPRQRTPRVGRPQSRQSPIQLKMRRRILTHPSQLINRRRRRRPAGTLPSQLISSRRRHRRQSRTHPSQLISRRHRQTHPSRLICRRRRLETPRPCTRCATVTVDDLVAPLSISTTIVSQVYIT